jgi:hypothetical protein
MNKIENLYKLTGCFSLYGAHRLSYELQNFTWCYWYGISSYQYQLKWEVLYHAFFQLGKRRYF